MDNVERLSNYRLESREIPRKLDPRPTGEILSSLVNNIDSQGDIEIKLTRVGPYRSQGYTVYCGSEAIAYYDRDPFQFSQGFMSPPCNADTILVTTLLIRKILLVK